MDFLIGSLSTLFVGYFVYKVYNQEKTDNAITTITYSQSNIHQLIKPFLPTNKEILAYMPLKTQSKAYLDKIYVNVVVFEGKAYWIKDNVFFTAEADGSTILKETAVQVDTMTMDKVELDKMAFIVDLLTKGERQ